MEIKDNKLIIDIPQGMEIDTENSNLAEGIIKFKPKCTTYDDIVNSFSSIACINVCMHSSNINKLTAMAQLMNIAKFYNGDWEPEWNNRNEDRYYIYCHRVTGEYLVDANLTDVTNAIYFKNKADAQAVIDNPNFRPILDAIYKE